MSDERDRRMLDHTRTLRRYTVVIAVLTVVNTAFVGYSALKERSRAKSDGSSHMTPNASSTKATEFSRSVWMYVRMAS
jgi:hypothetical protein